jgi:ATP-dependent DNA helicase RecQ
MAQYQAGYFIEGIRKLFIKDKDYDKISGIIHQLSFFDLNTETDLTKTKNDSVIAVFNNLVTRGLPTIPSAFVEDFISTTFSRTRKKTESDNKLEYNFLNDDLKKNILRALHIIDPRIDKKPFEKNKTKIKSEKEELKNTFLFETVTVNFGDYLLQLIDNNRSIQEICKFSEDLKQDIEDLKTNGNYNFLDDNSDLSIEIPYIEKEQRGIIITIDESQAIDNTDYKVEENKKEFLKKIYWNYDAKIKKDDFHKTDSALDALSFFTFNSYFDTLKKNYSSPLYKEEEGLDALQITLSPLGIARIQKTIIEFIFAGKLELNAKEWKIAVIERDIPCAFVAVEDLKHYLNNLFKLEGKNRKLPKINLSVYYSEEFENAEINVLYQGEKELIKNFKKANTYDLLIDISVLIRVDCDFDQIKNSAKNFAVIRSVKRINSNRKFYTEDLIVYQPVINFNLNKTEAEDDEEIEIQDALRFFLKSIFRKNDFLTKQLEFINQALQLKNTLGLMPFSQGKTLAFEFASLLQPGISLVINPVMSLMKEQFDELKDYGIDGTYYINSSHTKYYEKLKAIRKFKEGESIITFVSADRFQTEDFRTDIIEMTAKEKYFSYIIIDEAHCLSEWSHDFREAYSIIPLVADRICKTRNFVHVPVLATTAYASYDVISSIVSKLKLENEPVRAEINQADNLNFNLKKVELEEFDEIKENEKAKTGIEVKKQLLLNQIIENAFSDKKNNVLVICSNKKGLLSVETDKNDGITTKLINNFKNLKIGKFEGVIDDSIYSVGGLKAKESYLNYKQFKNNELDILISNKSIGIGLNINNLRNLVHLNYPLSFESFIQLNQRAGRDFKKYSVTVISNNQKLKYKEKDYKPDNIGKINVIDIEKESTVDFETQYDFLKKTYGNRFKEEIIFNELLTKITFQREKPINYLKEKIEEEFNEKFILTSQPGTKPYQLHIEKKSGKLIGYIDFKSNKIVVKASSFEVDLAEQILFFAKKDIENKMPENSDIIQLLENENQIPEKDGIDVIIKNLKSGEEAELIIGFTNSYLNRITDIIRKFLDDKFDVDLLKIYNESFDFEEFKSILLNKHNINITKLTTNTLIEFKEIFIKVRGFYDTIRIVNKLLILNVLTDYTVDYSKHQIKLKFAGKDDNDFMLSVYNYLLLYTSKDRAIKIFEDIPNYTGDSILTKSINYFNNFWFDNIVNKRINSLQVLSDITQNESSDELNYKVQKLQNNYFTSQYNNELTINSLHHKTNNFTDNSFSIIEYYIAEIGCLKNNWKHLLNSTEELLRIHPNNNVLSILNGYCEVLLNIENDEIISNAITKITDSFALMGIYKGVKLDEVSEKTDWIIEKIYEQNLDLKKKINCLIILKVYNSWLKLFNRKLLSND